MKKEDSIGLAYHIPCAGANSTPCTGTYVGETERTVAARFQEHKSTASNALGRYKSAMLQHARDNNHHFRKEDVSILSYEQDWTKRGIKEALFIRALSPSINIDPGRHSLSSHFDTLIKNNIHTPPTPAPHNAETETLINTAPRCQGRPRREVMPQSQQSGKTLPKQQQQQQQLQQQQLVRRSKRIRAQQ